MTKDDTMFCVIIILRKRKNGKLPTGLVSGHRSLWRIQRKRMHGKFWNGLDTVA
jgi:hypothetical protein